MNKNWLSCYRIEPLLLVQELSKVLWRRTQHPLLLKVLDSSLWFLVEPARDPHTQSTLWYHSINRMRLNWEVCVTKKRTSQSLAQWSLFAVWGPRTALGCPCLTSGCCSCRCQTRPWSPESWCSHSGLWSLGPWSLCSLVLRVSPGLGNKKKEP